MSQQYKCFYVCTRLWVDEFLIDSLRRQAIKLCALKSEALSSRRNLQIWFRVSFLSQENWKKMPERGWTLLKPKRPWVTSNLLNTRKMVKRKRRARGSFHSQQFHFTCAALRLCDDTVKFSKMKCFKCEQIGEGRRSGWVRRGKCKACKRL